jgi:hypothetical protein
MERITSTLRTLDPIPLSYLDPIHRLVWHIYIVKPATSPGHPRISLVPPVLSLKPVLFSRLISHLHFVPSALRISQEKNARTTDTLLSISDVYEGKLIYFWIFIHKEGGGGVSQPVIFTSTLQLPVATVGWCFAK